MGGTRSRRGGGNGSAAIPAFFLYGEAPRPPHERTVHVETVAARSRLHGWHIRPHRHGDLHQVLLLRRGRVEATIDDRSSALRPPALIVVPPGSVHSFRFQEHTAGVVISFANTLARDLAATAGGLMDFLESAAMITLDRARLEATDVGVLADMLLRECERSARARDAALQGLLGALLANLMRLAQLEDVTTPGAPARDRRLVARFRQLVERHFREHAGISRYARELGTSETRLRKACLACAGQSPVRLVHQRLLVEAERQLRYTSMSVTEVAYYLGFDDPAYFSRFFTGRMRLSPRAFRNGDGGG
jgi:AraC family transcriptional activator of pobA